MNKRFLLALLLTLTITSCSEYSKERQLVKTYVEADKSVQNGSFKVDQFIKMDTVITARDSIRFLAYDLIEDDLYLGDLESIDLSNLNRGSINAILLAYKHTVQVLEETKDLPGSKIDSLNTFYETVNRGYSNAAIKGDLARERTQSEMKEVIKNLARYESNMSDTLAKFFYVAYRVDPTKYADPFQTTRRNYFFFSFDKNFERVLSYHSTTRFPLLKEKLDAMN